MFNINALKVELDQAIDALNQLTQLKHALNKLKAQLEIEQSNEWRNRPRRSPTLTTHNQRDRLEHDLPLIHRLLGAAGSDGISFYNVLNNTRYSALAHYIRRLSKFGVNSEEGQVIVDMLDDFDIALGPNEYGKGWRVSSVRF